MHIKEIQTNEEIQQTLAILPQIYDQIFQNDYILNMIKHGYKMAAVFEDSITKKEECVGIVGIRIINKLQYQKVLEIEDFIIDQNKIDGEVEKMLLHWVEQQASIFKCKNIIGQLETKRKESQKIFSQKKFILDGFLFRKSC